MLHSLMSTVGHAKETPLAVHAEFSDYFKMRHFKSPSSPPLLNAPSVMVLPLEAFMVSHSLKLSVLCDFTVTGI